MSQNDAIFKKSLRKQPVMMEDPKLKTEILKEKRSSLTFQKEKRTIERSDISPQTRGSIRIFKGVEARRVDKNSSNQMAAILSQPVETQLCFSNGFANNRLNNTIATSSIRLKQDRKTEVILRRHHQIYRQEKEEESKLFSTKGPRIQTTYQRDYTGEETRLKYAGRHICEDCGEYVHLDDSDNDRLPCGCKSHSVYRARTNSDLKFHTYPTHQTYYEQRMFASLPHNQTNSHERFVCNVKHLIPEYAAQVSPDMLAHTLPTFQNLRPVRQKYEHPATQNHNIKYVIPHIYQKPTWWNQQRQTKASLGQINFKTNASQFEKTKDAKRKKDSSAKKNRLQSTKHSQPQEMPLGEELEL